MKRLVYHLVSAVNQTIRTRRKIQEIVLKAISLTTKIKESFQNEAVLFITEIKLDMEKIIMKI